MDCKITCEICFQDQNSLVEMNCKHSLCFNCFMIAVVPKEICPFCKQSVTHIMNNLKVCSIEEFEKPIQKQADFFEESNFDLIDETFFQDDIRILNSNLNRANQFMIKNVRQTDQLFNLKWYIFEQIEQSIVNLQFTNSLNTFQEITHLNSCLNCIITNSWESNSLDDLKNAYNYSQKEEQYQFIFVTKQKKNKKRKQKQ